MAHIFIQIYGSAFYSRADWCLLENEYAKESLTTKVGTLTPPRISYISARTDPLDPCLHCDQELEDGES